MKIHETYKLKTCKVYVQIVKVDAEEVTFCRKGGGLNISLSPIEFSSRYVPFDLVAEPFVKRHVGLDEGKYVVAAYVRESEKWNGWDVPYFTKEGGLWLIDKMSGLQYNEAADSFQYTDPEMPEAIDDFSAIEIDVAPDQRRRLYSIGGGMWTWVSHEQPHEVASYEVAPVAL